MRTVVPFDGRDPNSRLAPVLSRDERRGFAAAMLRDVVDAVRGAGGDPVVVATAPLDDAPAGAEVVVDDRSLDAAVTDALAPPAAVVMSDLALATPGALRRAFAAAPADGVAAAPGLGGGTNVLVTRTDFETDYHGVSFRDHAAAAAAADRAFARVDSFRLAVDVDAPADLVEVLLHGDGRAADWLRDAGFAVATRDGRATAVRDGND